MNVITFNDVVKYNTTAFYIQAIMFNSVAKYSFRNIRENLCLLAKRSCLVQHAC